MSRIVTITLKEYLTMTNFMPMNGYGLQHNRPYIYCEDGFSVRIDTETLDNKIEDWDFLSYETVDISYLSEVDKTGLLKDEYIAEYLTRDIGDPYVMYRVPLNIAEELIERHGNIDVIKTCREYFGYDCKSYFQK